MKIHLIVIFILVFDLFCIAFKQWCFLPGRKAVCQQVEYHIGSGKTQFIWFSRVKLFLLERNTIYACCCMCYGWSFWVLFRGQLCVRTWLNKCYLKLLDIASFKFIVHHSHNIRMFKFKFTDSKAWLASEVAKLYSWFGFSC